MSKIRIGFVGTGYMGQKAHLANYAALEDCEVAALAEPRKELAEKPLSLSIEAGEKLAGLAKENGVIYMVGYHKRSDPAMEYAKQLTDTWKESGEYGRMRYVRITMPPGDWVGGAGAALSSTEACPRIVTETDVPYFDKEAANLYNV